MNDIRTEYGLSGALALGSLYAGGSIIAAGSGGYYGSIPSSGAIALRQFGGHSAPPSILDTQTVGIGVRNDYGYVSTGYRGTSNTVGSVSDGTSNLYSGAAIKDIYHISTLNRVYFSVLGSLSNSGWTTMTIGSTSFTRSSASFTTSGGNTTWYWASISSHPFTGIGSISVTWE